MSIDWMNQDRKKIVNFLEGLLPEGLGKIKDAARYSAVNSKAHFWRPLLAFASGKAYGVESDKILPYSLTPELFHTASLIMDDLPSMDDADFRRGKPSCHKKFDIATTDLCFYYLIEKARTIIQDSDLPNESKMKILKISTETSFQLIEGQKRDLYGVAADKDLVFDGKITFDKATDVYHSATRHDEDQVPHLKIIDPNICFDQCKEEFGNPCQYFCPASVYEVVNENNTDRLQINFSNCVHCKTCDIMDPYQTINWVPPESGDGPSWKNM